MECGYAPGRAFPCTEWGDGGFQCCFTASRCPAVGGMLNRTTKSYHLSYTIEWTLDIAAVKPMQGGVIDVSDGTIEWNVGPNLTNPKANQVCNETICNISQTYIVDHLPIFGETGLCPGTMLFSYMHEHNGGHSGSMYVNGQHVCSSWPKHGTDPNNAPGNELGYIVGFDLCIDQDTLNNTFRFEKGDEVRLEALYDVDVNSNVSYPMPGGKHGGIMALFFFTIDCDPGTYVSEWVCRDNQCLEVAPNKHKGQYKSLQDCSASCETDPGLPLFT